MQNFKNLRCRYYAKAHRMQTGVALLIVALYSIIVVKDTFVIIVAQVPKKTFGISMATATLATKLNVWFVLVMSLQLGNYSMKVKQVAKHLRPSNQHHSLRIEVKSYTTLVSKAFWLQNIFEIVKF